MDVNEQRTGMDQERRRTDIIGFDIGVELFKWDLLWGEHGCVFILIM